MASFQSLLQKRYAKGVASNTQKHTNSDKDESEENERDTKKPRASLSADVSQQPELPHFLILGAQKAGTMAAVLNLNKHPNIFCWKEPHYFDAGWHTKSLSWYRNHFTSAMSSNPNLTVVGEKTPELIYVDECANRIKSVCPHAKFLLFLRNPVTRAYSSWNMNTNKLRESETFEESIERNLHNLNEIRSYGTAEFHHLQRGFYMDQIERFLKVLPDRSKLLIVIAERIRRNPAAEYARIFDFLGVPQCPEIHAEDDHMGTYPAERQVMSDKIRKKLKDIYRSHNERLYRFLGYRIHEWEDAPSTAADTNASKTDATSKDSHSENGAFTNKDLTSDSNNQEKLRGAVQEVAVPKQIQDRPIGIECSTTGDFAQLGRKHGTDKVTHHGYHRFYPRFIEQYRTLEGSAMLEIGIDQSCSLHMWLSYFPKAFIYGIDINVSKSGSRFKIFKADQSNIPNLKIIVQQEISNPLFFIIDDGSHIPEHQVACFDYLFGSILEPGGCYIIEDIETSYWTRSGLYGYNTRYGYHHERSVVEIFKDLLDDINREFLTEQNRRAQDYRIGNEISLNTRMAVSSVTFGHNCIIIMKKTKEEAEYTDRVYRYRKNL